MSAYVIADIEITDPEAYAEYRTLSTQAAEQYGGRFLVRGGAVTVLEGDWTPGRFVVAEFPDRETAERWWSSPEYERAKAIRQRAARSRMLLVEGA